MSDCHCCHGVEPSTPRAVANRPGLDALDYRVGTHAGFLATMQARLSQLSLGEGGTGPDGGPRPLAGLRTRASDDPTIAFLDGWATVADVLSFYNERIATEGFLRTATERRSVVELARLVGYRPRPGVAATVHLAFSLEQGYRTTIPAGTRAQSVPAPGETMESFETWTPLEARAEWNEMRPRRRVTQEIHARTARAMGEVALQGTSTGLRPGDALLFLVKEVRTVEGGPSEDGPRPLSDRPTPVLRIVASVKPEHTQDPALQRTVVSLVPPDGLVGGATEELVGGGAGKAVAVKELVGPVVEPELQETVAGPTTEDGSGKDGPGGFKRPIRVNRHARVTGALQVASVRRPPIRLPARSVGETLAPRSESVVRMLTTLTPLPDHDPVDILANTEAVERLGVEVVALRMRAAPFGHNAPPRPEAFDEGRKLVVHGEWKVNDPLNRAGFTPPSRRAFKKNTDQPPPVSQPVVHSTDVISLDGDYDVVPGAWVAITGPPRQVTLNPSSESPIRLPTSAPVVFQVGDGTSVRRSLAAYGLSGRSLTLQIPEQWFTDLDADRSFDRVRGTTVYAGNERLELADVEDETDLVAGLQSVPLDGLYDGLEAGRWLIVSGEQVIPHAPQTTGVHGTELVLLAGAEHSAGDRRGDKLHTTLHLVRGLAYGYKRATVTIYGNVVAASHGETRSEVLGSGDGTKANQTFGLRQPPLTHLPAATAEGAESTLEVTVNDVIWREADDLSLLGPDGRGFMTRSDDDGTTSVVFGDGRRGARLPTGVENVKAVYRRGIGAGGNVKASQISLLATRPLGVKSVVNPRAASGGADRDTRDQARANAPLAVTALGRLVSVQDYEDFARTFAGIAKASARRLSDGQRTVVHVTVAGVGDADIDPSSALYRNLLGAFRRLGDPHQPVELAVRERLLLVIGARLKVAPDRRWDTVEPAVRAALLDAFGFERRTLGQGVHPSEVIAVAGAVPGVAYVDLDTLRSVSKADLTPELTILQPPAEVSGMPAVLPALPARRWDALAATTLPTMPATEVSVEADDVGFDHLLVADAALPDEPVRTIEPAQLLYLTPDIPDTLILTEITT